MKFKWSWKTLEIPVPLYDQVLVRLARDAQKGDYCWLNLSKGKHSSIISACFRLVHFLLRCQKKTNRAVAKAAMARRRQKKRQACILKLENATVSPSRAKSKTRQFSKWSVVKICFLLILTFSYWWSVARAFLLLLTARPWFSTFNLLRRSFGIKIPSFF